MNNGVFIIPLFYLLELPLLYYSSQEETIDKMPIIQVQIFRYFQKSNPIFPLFQRNISQSRISGNLATYVLVLQF